MNPILATQVRGGKGAWPLAAQWAESHQLPKFWGMGEDGLRKNTLPPPLRATTVGVGMGETCVDGGKYSPPLPQCATISNCGGSGGLEGQGRVSYLPPRRMIKS